MIADAAIMTSIMPNRSMVMMNCVLILMVLPYRMQNAKPYDSQIAFASGNLVDEPYDA